MRVALLFLALGSTACDAGMRPGTAGPDAASGEGGSDSGGDPDGGAGVDGGRNGRDGGPRCFAGVPPTRVMLHSLVGYLNLSTGAVEIPSSVGLAGPTRPWHVATPSGQLWVSEGTQIAQLPSTAFEDVTACDAAAATFAPQETLEPFTSDRVVLIRTSEGEIYELGNSEFGEMIDVEGSLSFEVWFDYSRIVPGGTEADIDAGTDEVDGGRPDDAGMMMMSDASTPVCSDITGFWWVGAILAPCGAAGITHELEITAGATACDLTVASSDASRPALDGTISLAADDSLTGTLSAGGEPAASCTGSLSGSTLTFVCGSCTMQVRY